MPIVVMLTVWKQKHTGLGYWHLDRPCTIVGYEGKYAKLVDPEVVKLGGRLAAIGAYRRSKKGKDFSRLNPVYFEIEKKPNEDLQLINVKRIDKDMLVGKCSSLDFINVLKDIGAYDYRYWCFLLEDSEWEKVVKKLNIVTPSWWEKLRKTLRKTSSFIVQKLESRYKADDGHYVRSRAELIIDNWLYHHKILHAYEARLPGKENIFCDFYLPHHNIYIEYWGLEGKPEYSSKIKRKKRIYKEKRLKLIELRDEDLEKLDDILKRKLAEFNVHLE